jgi:hypothetical protein
VVLSEQQFRAAEQPPRLSLDNCGSNLGTVEDVSMERFEKIAKIENQVEALPMKSTQHMIVLFLLCAG